MAAMCVIAGCPTRTSIADINKDPGRFANKDISISGTVSEAFGALGNGVFQWTMEQATYGSTAKIMVFRATETRLQSRAGYSRALLLAAATLE
jgi:hypothetical protein